MSAWDSPAATGGGNPDWDANAGSADWNGGGGEGNLTSAGDQEFNDFGANDAGGFGGDAGGEDGTNNGDDSCRNCGQSGHFARDCTEPRKMGACFNCGEEGHSKAECTKPRVFKGTCNDCGQEDKFLPLLASPLLTVFLRHAARDCPTKVKICKNCLEEGHEAIECKNRKTIDNSDVADKTEAEGWEMLKEASKTRDLDDFKDAVKILLKAVPTYTYPQLEKEYRSRGFKVFTVAMEKDTLDTWTNCDLQGNIGKKYAIGYYFSEKPQRPSLVDKWPSSPEENLDRLADAGVPMDRGVEKCNNCGVLGHTVRQCTQDLIPIERATVTCALCSEQGHRVRDCTQERQKPREPRACKICEETDHMAKDCPKREKRTCRKCGSEDHMAKECDIIKCDNCDAEGHEWRDCTAPKDWSRVTCRNCKQKGHTIKRCKEPIKEDENAAGGQANSGNRGFGAADTKTAGGGDWDAGAAAVGGSANNDWENTAPAVAVGGGW